MAILRRVRSWAGQDKRRFVEYAVILCLLVVAILLVIALMGNEVKTVYFNISGALQN